MSFPAAMIWHYQPLASRCSIFNIDRHVKKTLRHKATLDFEGLYLVKWANLLTKIHSLMNSTFECLVRYLVQKNGFFSVTSLNNPFSEIDAGPVLLCADNLSDFQILYFLISKNFKSTFSF